MLARYTSAQMQQIWSDEHKIELWHRVEMAVIRAYCRAGVFPPETVDLAANHPVPTLQSVVEHEAATGHDVVGFLRAWTAGMPVELASRVHRGLTSSDVVDTALAITLAETSVILRGRLDTLVETLREHALSHLNTERIGRTHGQHATRDTWGHRIAEFATATARARQRFISAAEAVATAKLSGPTGTYEHIPPAVEREALSALGVHRSEVSSQIVLRDRIATWMCELAQAATICEAVATEVRLGQISDIAEVFEAAGSGQVGSSAMPHKRNPVRAEKICGLARVVRGYLTPVLENVVSWQQRDIVHSSVERICLPDTSSAAEHILHQTTTMIENLVVDGNRMALNLSRARIASQTHAAVVALMDQGFSYVNAHDIVSAATKGVEIVDLHAEIEAAAAAADTALNVDALREALRPKSIELVQLREYLQSI